MLSCCATKKYLQTLCLETFKLQQLSNCRLVAKCPPCNGDGHEDGEEHDPDEAAGASALPGLPGLPALLQRYVEEGLGVSVVEQLCRHVRLEG